MIFMHFVRLYRKLSITETVIQVKREVVFKYLLEIS
jgi:hypothetical protein